jgi:hypothetical protein
MNSSLPIKFNRSFSKLAIIGFILGLIVALSSIPLTIIFNMKGATFNQEILKLFFSFLMILIMWVGIIISHIAYHKIKKYGLRGRWMAILGFSLGYSFLIYHYGLQSFI